MNDKANPYDYNRLLPFEQRKWLVFDTDRSLSTLGGDDDIAELLGFPPVRVDHGVSQLRYLMGQVLAKRRVPHHHPLLDDAGSVDVRTIPNKRGLELGLGGLIIDTFSTLAAQEMRQVIARRNESRLADGDSALETPDQHAYNVFRDVIMRLVHDIKMTDLPMVVNVHTKKGQDHLGAVMEDPAVVGGARNDMLRYFDAVFYTRVRTSASGETPLYLWQTKPDDRRPNAKARRIGHQLPMYLAQDLEFLFRTYEAAGVTTPKVLIIGESGQGKTHALMTLNKTGARHLGLTPIVDLTGREAAGAASVHSTTTNNR